MTGIDRRAKARAVVIDEMSADERAKARALAEGEMYLAACGVTQQMRRLQQGEQPGPEYMVDGRLFAEAVRAAVRAGELCALLADRERAGKIQAAADRVHSAIPNAVDVRDALEHFDDYILGLGNQQKSQPGPFTQSYARGGHPQVMVGPLVLDVELAERAVMHLASVALAGEDYFNLLP